jgi:hypothetical protein
MTSFWSAASVKTGCEPQAIRNLRFQGYESFYPYWITSASSSGGGAGRGGHPRLRIIPAFPGYVFIRLAEGDSYHSIHSTYGVRKLLLRTSRDEFLRPARVLDEFIESMRRLRRRDGPGQALLPPGTRVRIVRGPLAEQRALVSMSSHDRVRLLLALFSGRETVVELDVSDVAPVPEVA